MPALGQLRTLQTALPYVRLSPEADENYAKADMPVGMSAFRRRADVVCQGLSGPFLAKLGSLAKVDTALVFRLSL